MKLLTICTLVFLFPHQTKQSCPTSLICQFSPWLQWSPCSCGTSLRRRNRLICCPDGLEIHKCLTYCNVSPRNLEQLGICPLSPKCTAAATSSQRTSPTSFHFAASMRTPASPTTFDQSTVSSTSTTTPTSFKTATSMTRAGKDETTIEASSETTRPSTIPSTTVIKYLTSNDGNFAEMNETDGAKNSPQRRMLSQTNSLRQHGTYWIIVGASCILGTSVCGIFCVFLGKKRFDKRKRQRLSTVRAM